MKMAIIICVKCKKVNVDDSDKSQRCGRCKARSGQHHKNFRANALKHYGAKCMNIECPVIPGRLDENDLDVHHKREVSDFPDNATVQEINSVSNAEIYCKICHSRKHRSK
jgi:hypothetical protein